MNLAHFLAVLRARWLPAVIGFVVVMAAAVAHVALAPRIYLAQSTLLIDAKPDPVSSLLYGSGTSPALINTQLEIIRSDRVAERVIQNLKLTDAADMRAMWKDSAKNGIALQDWLVNVLQNGLEAQVARPGSSVITVGYHAMDPRFAATAANAFVRAYLETSIELRVDPAKQYSGFFTDQMKESRDALTAAQVKLSNFQKEHGIIGTDDRMDIETGRLNQLSTDLVTVQGEQATASTRAAQVRGNPSESSEVLANPTIAGLKNDLRMAELKLDELTGRYGDKHPMVMDARAAVADLKAKLARETSTVTTAVSGNANASSARVQAARAALDEQRNKVLALKELRDQGNVLAQDVANAQRSYDLVMTRASQTNLESQNRQSNATIISQANAPAEPSSPKVLANLLMGFVAAVGVGLGLALLLEQFDKRVRTTSDAVDFLGLPVIGIMPSPTISRRLKGQLALSQERVISGRRLAAPDKGHA